MKPPGRRARLFAAGAALLLLLAWFAVWTASARALRRSVASWADDQRAAGVAVAYSQISARGFPLFLRGVAKDVEIGEAGSWRWRAPRLSIDMQPLAPRRIAFSASEPHELDLGRFGRWRIDAPRGMARLHGDAERGWSLELEATDGEIVRAGGATIVAKTFMASAAPSAVDPKRVFIGAAARDAVLTRDGAALGIEELEAAFAATAIGAIGEGALAWREAGGAIEIERLIVRAQKASLALSGTLAVDAAGYPSGRLNAQIVNPAPMIEAMARAGLLQRRDADLAKAALTLAAVAGGGKITAPIILAEGEASIVGVRLARLSRLADQP